MKPETQEVLNRVKQNMQQTSPDKVKQDFYNLIEAVVEVFVDAEPKLVDKTIDPDLKGTLFFKSLGRLALQGGEAWMNRAYIPDDKNEFIQKLKKFMQLEEVLMHYSQ